jgi:hypothetical protein
MPFSCSKRQIEQTHQWIRKELENIKIHDIINQSTMATAASPPKKKKKSSLFENYSNASATNATQMAISSFDDDENEEKPNIHANVYDELDHYLYLVKKTENEKESNNEDPLPWWNKHKSDLKKMAILTRRIFSIPATSAAVERQFSTAGMIFNERRTRLSGQNLENTILIRSMKNQDKNDLGTLD